MYVRMYSCKPSNIHSSHSALMPLNGYLIEYMYMYLNFKAIVTLNGATFTCTYMQCAFTGLILWCMNLCFTPQRSHGTIKFNAPVHAYMTVCLTQNCLLTSQDASSFPSCMEGQTGSVRSLGLKKTLGVKEGQFPWQL